MAEGVLSSSPQASADRRRAGAGIRGGCGPARLPTAAARKGRAARRVRLLRAAASAARLPRPAAV